MHPIAVGRWFRSRWGLSVAVMLVAIVLVCVTARPAEAEPAGGKTTQRMVRVRVDGASFLLVGDSLIGTDEALNGGALPYLTRQGYRIAAVHMTASAGVNPEQHAALVTMEKPE